jgi:ABC-type antimicrobial peptide transport system permease subunit
MHPPVTRQGQVPGRRIGWSYSDRSAWRASVVGRGAALAAVGCIVGVAAGGALAILIRSLLYGIRPFDPLTFTVVPAVLFAIAALAAGIPAARAATIEAVQALRSE